RKRRNPSSSRLRAPARRGKIGSRRRSARLPQERRAALLFPVAFDREFGHIGAACGESRASGCSSGVEHNLAKVGVEGSNPFARSSFPTSPKPRNSAAFVVSGRLKSQGAEAARKAAITA